MSSSLIQVRIDSKLKDSAENILEAMGMRTSEAIRVFLQQIINDKAFPFKPSLNIPNQATIDSFEEIKAGEYEDSSLEEFKTSLSNLTKLTNEKGKTNKTGK